ncbi:MAG: hypothetical protein AB8U82_01820 [Rickettsia endosymbiont of Haemaphysalis japonica]
MSIIINNIDDIMFNNIDDIMYIDDIMSFRNGVGLVAWLKKSAGCHPP